MASSSGEKPMKVLKDHDREDLRMKTKLLALFLLIVSAPSFALPPCGGSNVGEIYEESIPFMVDDTLMDSIDSRYECTLGVAYFNSRGWPVFYFYWRLVG